MHSQPQPADKRAVPRPAIVIDGVTKIPLGIDAKHGYAIVDADMSCLADHKWTLSSNGYAFGSLIVEGKRAFVYMHRLIMGLETQGFVDHISHDKLDNRRSNLRTATHSSNQANKLLQGGTSQYKGVMKLKRVRTPDVWRARIKVNQLNIYLGNYKTEKEAAIAYNKAALKYFSDHALLNDV